MPARHRTELRERLAVGDPELELDEVEAGDLLGHGVLDLDAPVQLEEEHIVPVDEELGRAGALVPDGATEGDRMLGEPAEHVVGEAGRRRLLDDLLVPSLHRAVARSEREDVTVTVAHELHLDVPGVLELALEIDGAVAERRLGLPGRRLERLVELIRPLHDTHAAAASARCSFDENGKPSSAGWPASSVGTPAAAAIRFASSLSPPRRSASGGGPIQVRPASSTASANAALSARKP